MITIAESTTIFMIQINVCGRRFYFVCKCFFVNQQKLGNKKSFVINFHCWVVVAFFFYGLVLLLLFSPKQFFYFTSALQKYVINNDEVKHELVFNARVQRIVKNKYERLEKQITSVKLHTHTHIICSALDNMDHFVYWSLVNIDAVLLLLLFLVLLMVTHAVIWFVLNRTWVLTSTLTWKKLCS